MVQNRSKNEPIYLTPIRQPADFPLSVHGEGLGVASGEPGTTG